MNSKRIVIDSRRKVNSGIGRVSQWLASNIKLGICEDIKITHLINQKESQQDYNFDNNETLETKIKPFSSHEFYELPLFLEKFDFDLYINPQLPWSPYHKTPSINIIHDLWTMKFPEWLPLEDDLKNRFGILDINYFKFLVNWFNDSKAEKYLTPYGLEKWNIVKNSDNDIWKGCWAQLAATTALSKELVVVSQQTKEEVEKYFKSGTKAKIIYNCPQQFNNRPPMLRKHFLTLSKLELRKNIHFLIDSYIKYFDHSITKLPLIIVGDPGYDSVSQNILYRIAKLQKLGYDITFLASISDKDLKKLFSETAALIFPSHFEGFGLPALEAMLSYIPVIATKTGMMETELGDNAILIDGIDSSELSRLMEKVSIENYCIEKIKIAHNKVKQYFEKENPTIVWGKIIELLLDTT